MTPDPVSGMRNEALRAHVTAVGFHLTLARSQIAAMVYLSEMRDRSKNRRDIDFGTVQSPKAGHPRGRIFSLWAPAAGALIERGLATHTIHPAKYDKSGRIIDNGHKWSITRAGDLVVELLRESGLYDEYAADLRPRVEVITR